MAGQLGQVTLPKFALGGTLTQDTNYSIGEMVINTQDTNNSIRGMVINIDDTNYSIGGTVINTRNTK